MVKEWTPMIWEVRVNTNLKEAMREVLQAAVPVTVAMMLVISKTMEEDIRRQISLIPLPFQLRLPPAVMLTNKKVAVAMAIRTHSHPLNSLHPIIQTISNLVMETMLVR